MAVERWCLNPVDEGTGDLTTPSPLELTSEDGTSGIHLVSVDYPPLATTLIKAQSVSTEGAQRAARALDTKAITINFLVIEPEVDNVADTNLMRDPSGEGDASKWNLRDMWTTGVLHSGVDGAVVSQITDFNQASTSDRCVQVITAGSVASEGVEGLVSDDPTANVFSSGVTYRFDVFLRGAAGGETLALKLGVSGDLATQNITLTTAYARYGVTWTPSGNRTGVHFGIVAQATSVKTFYVDCGMVRRGATATGYFDGDFPGCEWDSSPRASLSRRIAPGARRYRIAGDLEQAVESVGSRGQGTLRRNTPGGQQVTFDLIDANLDWDSQSFIDCGVASGAISFVCEPFGRGVEIAPTEVTNLILNPSAETDVTLWTTTNNTVTQQAAQNAVGADAFQLSSTAGGAMSIATTTGMVVSPVKRYQCSAYFKTAVSARSCNVKVDWLNASGAIISTSTGANVSDATTGWILGTVTGIAPVLAVTAKVTCTVLATGAGAEIHYVDGIIFHQGDTLQPFFDGTFPNAFWTGIANLSASTKLGDFCNLCSNPSFSIPSATPRAGWVTTDADVSLTVSSDFSVVQGNGYQSVKLVNPVAGAGDDDYIGFTLPAIYVKPNTTYSAGAWVNVQSFVAGALSNRGLLLFDTATSATAGATITASTPGWVRLTTSITTGTDPTTLVVRLYAPQATTYWDNVLLIEGATLPAYFDGDTPGYAWCGLQQGSESMGLHATVQKTLPVGSLSLKIKGNAEAIGRMTYCEGQNIGQSLVIWGESSDSVDISNPFQQVYIAGSNLERLNNSTYAGIGLRSQVLGSTDTYIASTLQSALTNAPQLQHLGSYRVIARVQGLAALGTTITLALEWSDNGFLTYTRNKEVSIIQELKGRALLVDLGMIRVRTPVRGPVRWQGRISARTVTGISDQLDIGALIVIPVDSSGEIRSKGIPDIGNTIFAQDPFTAITAGTALTGRTVPVSIGGVATWTTSGATTDFVAADYAGGIETETRSTINDSGVGRLATLNISNSQDIDVSLDVRGSTSVSWQTTLWARSQGVFLLYATNSTLQLYVGGTLIDNQAVIYPPNAFYRLRLIVYNSGNVYGYLLTASGQVVASLRGRDARVMPGGTFQTGNIGWSDFATTAGASVRDYDNYLAVAAAPEQVVAAPGQLLELRNDGVSRTDQTGTYWSTPPVYEGEYLTLHPSRKGRQATRVSVAPSRVLLGQTSDFIDDFGLKFAYTPRYPITPDGA